MLDVFCQHEAWHFVLLKKSYNYLWPWSESQPPLEFDDCWKRQAPVVWLLFFRLQRNRDCENQFYPSTSLVLPEIDGVSEYMFFFFSPHFTQLKDCWVLTDIENQNRTLQGFVLLAAQNGLSKQLACSIVNFDITDLKNHYAFPFYQ